MLRNLDIIEAAAGGPFTLRHDGEIHVLPDPATLPFEQVLTHLHDEHAPQTPGMPIWKRDLLFRAWAAHYDLPPLAEAERLAYLIDRYRSALVYDLRAWAGVDLGDLWRARRWRTLLDLIDHLPGHSWYSSAVAGDEEHALMIAKAVVQRGKEGEQAPSGPALHTWTPEVAAITTATDAVRHLGYILQATNGDKKAKPPEPLPRPQTPLERAIKAAEHERRQAKHNALAHRMLPHKR